MELRPIEEKSKALYPTAKNAPKINFKKELFLATSISISQPVILYVAVPCYVAVVSNTMPIAICGLIRWIFAIVSIFSSISLYINKIKINKCIKENENTEKIEKLNKGKKIKLWILGISIAIVVITSLVIGYLENYK